MRVLVACEYSGIVRDAFIRRGHDAWSCDILDSDSKGPHIKGDVLNVLGDGWELMIAHPPCTYLCNSGVRWLERGNNKKRWKLMEEGADFFKKIIDAPVPKIAVENPVVHGYALKLIGRDFDQSIQPWEFGHGETKRTCLWLKNLPHLMPTRYVEGREHRIHRLSPGPMRGHERARTLVGIAEAMADQWGSYIHYFQKSIFD